MARCRSGTSTGHGLSRSAATGRLRALLVTPGRRTPRLPPLAHTHAVPTPLPARPTRRTMKLTSAPNALAAALLLLAAALPAQAMYKVVHPDGSVTYTDRPPATGNARVTPLGRNAEPAPPAPALPLELRQTMERFPVTLYSSTDCAPCDNGRRLLQARGVPYTERSVASDDDTLALERLVGGRTVPALTIGRQALRGLSEADWNSYLDAAGYPRQSRLPTNWQAPAATPLVQRAAPAAPATPPAAAAPAAPAAPEAPPAPVPGTLRF